MAQFSEEAIKRLENKKWRSSNSRWRLWIYFSMGLLGVVGFAMVAIKTKDKVLRKVALIFSGSTTLLFFLMSTSDSSSTSTGTGTDATTNASDPLGAIVLFVNLGAQIYASIKYNKIWLVYKAEDRFDNSWVASNLATSQPVVTQVVEPSSDLQEFGVSSADYYQKPQGEKLVRKAPPPPPPKPRGATTPPEEVVKPNQEDIGIVDLNSATVELLLKIPGFDSTLAAITTIERERRQGFSSFEDFASATNLQPHQMVKIRPNVIVQKSIEEQKKTGRILDI